MTFAFGAPQIDLVEEAFQGVAKVEFDTPPLPTFSDYVPDVTVTAQTATLAVYAATSEVKALEALLLWQELLRQGLTGVVPIVVLEAAKPPQIRARTMSRLLNSDVALAAMDGSRWEVVQKLHQRAGIRTPLH